MINYRSRGCICRCRLPLRPILRSVWLINVKFEDRNEHIKSWITRITFRAVILIIFHASRIRFWSVNSCKKYWFILKNSIHAFISNSITYIQDTYNLFYEMAKQFSTSKSVDAYLIVHFESIARHLKQPPELFCRKRCS